MGKSRRNRGGQAHRRDPMAKPVKPPSDPELAALREAKILPIINDLQSADPKSRSAAASVISSIIRDPRCRKLLLREQVVHTVLTQTLTDSALESRAAGWGILQVLAQEEEADFCVHLFRQDVLTAIEYASKLVTEKVLSKETPFPKLPKAEKSFTSSIAASLVSLLTALAEAGDEILEAISNNAVMIKLLFTLITHTSQEENDLVSPIREDAMACLMILCEDNTELAQRMTSTNDTACYETLLSLKSQVDGDGILACAILHNIYASLPGSKDSSQTDVADGSVLIPTLSKAIATFTPGQTVANGDDGWSSPAEYQQLALETLASIGTSLSAVMGGPAQSPKKEADGAEVADDDDDEDMDEAADGQSGDEGGELEGGDEDEDDEDDEEMDQDEMEADMDMVTGGDHNDDDIDDLPTLKALLQTAVPELARIASLQPADDLSIKVQAHALSALNNIAWSVSLVDFSEESNAGVKAAWRPVGRSLWQRVVTPILASDTADVDLATQVTSLAWAVSRALRGETPPLLPGEHRKFISLYQATKGAPARFDPEDPFQALGVKCVGVLGQLALHPAPADLNREVGAFLVTLLAGLPDGTPAADAVEALNQLFDVYANEEYAYDAQVFWKNGFLKHLDEVVPKARAMAKGISKGSQPELRNRADEAVLNLTRFLAYKRKHKPVELTVRER